MSKIICIFHSGCDDGFGAAWAVRHAIGEADVEFYPGVYGKEPPDVTGRHVIMVDFSYKRPVLEKVFEQCDSLLILDHHKTAAEDLAGFPPAGVSYHEWRQTMNGPIKAVGVLFDMERSGAGIAWDFFHNLAHPEVASRPMFARPEFINYIEDRDLWRKALPEGDQFTIALRSYPQDFQVWDTLVARGVTALIQEGRGIWRYYQARIGEMKRSAYLAQIRFDDDKGPDVSYRCFIANAPYFAASELAGELAAQDGAQFGACYFEVRPGEWQYSLRSRGDFDVSQIAMMFGGGGHKNAAGFTVPEPVHESLEP